MKLVPIRKEKDFMPVWSMFDDFMDRFFHDDLMENAKLMAVDVMENDKEFLVKANLPGIAKDKIKINVKDNRLVIEARQETEKETKDHGTILRSERFTGSYQRVISLPENCQHDGIQAKLENGVLQLIIPKKEPSPKKEIVIE